MSFANGSLTARRFLVRGKAHRRVDETLLGQLAARAIKRGTIQSADYTEVGWTTGQHILDTEFDLGKNAVADGLRFALRIDTHRAPAELVRSYQRMSEEAMLEAGGREFLSKAQRREAREQALARADAEARAGAFQRMKQVPVFWDLARNELYLGAAGSTVADYFMLLFRQTFDQPVVAASSGEMAARWATEAGQTRAFDDARPAHFVNPPNAVDGQSDGASPYEARTGDFLGTEWLTWLWYASHVESPEITGPGGEAITVLFEKSLQLDCAFNIGGQVMIRAEAPTRQPEAPVALAQGKRPVRAGLQIAAHGDVFTFTVRGDAMCLSGIRLPPPDDVANPGAVFEDRIARLRDLIDAVGELYGAFLKRRLSSKWPQTLAAMRNWAAAGRYAGSPTDGQSSASIGA